MKTKFILIILLAIAILVSSLSCSDADEVNQMAGTIQRLGDENDERIIGALHRVEYGDNVAYIFGTAHASRDGWFPLSDVVVDALRRSDVLYVEIEEIGMGETVFAQVATSRIHLPNNLTWLEFLPEDVYSHLVETLAKWQLTSRQNLAYDRINTINPMFLLFQLENEYIIGISEVNIGFEYAVDTHIVNLAREMGLPIYGLESSEQQLEILYNPPFEVMTARIMSFMSPEEFGELSGRAPLDELLNAYENNDFDSVRNNLATDMRVDNYCLFATYFIEIIASFRSTYYAHEIIRLLQETKNPTTFFIAVGLAHVVMSGGGEEFTDIIQQLELAGFAVISRW